MILDHEEAFLIWDHLFTSLAWLLDILIDQAESDRPFKMSCSHARTAEAQTDEPSKKIPVARQ